MDLVQEMISHAGLLYKIAFEKTDNSHDADDLVQETFLSTLKVLKSGLHIENMKAYLLKVLNSKYCDLLKNNNRMLISIEGLRLLSTDKPIEDSVSDLELQKSKEALAIRTELGYLSKKYREIMVQYYMEGKSVNEIASNLNVTKEVVKIRLTRGREKIKKGINKMDLYSENNYKPNSLTLTPSGFIGTNNEPFSIVTNTIDQNLLILAYDAPITIEQLSKRIGIPMAYVEEIIEKFIANELMSVSNNKVYTNFLIIDDELIQNIKEVQKKFVKKHFDESIIIFNEHANELTKTGILKKYNATQHFLYGLHSCLLRTTRFLVDTFKLLKEEDYPCRPNDGKWIIHYAHKSNNLTTVNSVNSYNIDNSFTTSTGNELLIEIWDTPISQSPWHRNKNVNPEFIGCLLYDLYKEKPLESQKLRQIPEFQKLGLIKSDNDKMIVNIPIITQTDYHTLSSINDEYSSRYIELMGDNLLDFINQNVIDYPKHIYPVSPYTHLMSTSKMSLSFVNQAAQKGIIKREKNRNYPICMIIEFDM